MNSVHTDGATPVLPPWPPGPCPPGPSRPPAPCHLTLLLATGPLHWLFRCWLSLPLREQAILQCRSLDRPPDCTAHDPHPPTIHRARPHSLYRGTLRLAARSRMAAPWTQHPSSPKGAPGTHPGAQVVIRGIKKSRRNRCCNSPKIPRFSGRSHTPAPSGAACAGP